MKRLYFDIETIPAPEHAKQYLEYLHQRKDEKKGKSTDFEDFLLNTSFDGAFGRILCIAYALDSAPVDALDGDEKTMLEEFWHMTANVDLFIGHNIHDFDLPFIVQRSVILGVKPTWQMFEEPGVPKYKVNKFLDFARYRNCPIFDTMWEWSHWGDSRNNKGLEHVALAMGLPTPKDGIDGSQVYEFFKKGKVKEIVEYCKRDVETNRAVYKRMTFENSKDLETLPF